MKNFIFTIIFSSFFLINGFSRLSIPMWDWPRQFRNIQDNGVPAGDVKPDFLYNASYEGNVYKNFIIFTREQHATDYSEAGLPGLEASHSFTHPYPIHNFTMVAVNASDEMRRFTLAFINTNNEVHIVYGDRNGISKPVPVAGACADDSTILNGASNATDRCFFVLNNNSKDCRAALQGFTVDTDGVVSAPLDLILKSDLKSSDDLTYSGLVSYSSTYSHFVVCQNARSADKTLYSATCSFDGSTVGPREFLPTIGGKSASGLQMAVSAGILCASTHDGCSINSDVSNGQLCEWDGSKFIKSTNWPDTYPTRSVYDRFIRPGDGSLKRILLDQYYNYIVQHFDELTEELIENEASQFAQEWSEHHPREIEWLDQYYDIANNRVITYMYSQTPTQDNHITCFDSWGGSATKKHTNIYPQNYSTQISFVAGTTNPNDAQDHIRKKYEHITSSDENSLTTVQNTVIRTTQSSTNPLTRWHEELGQLQLHRPLSGESVEVPEFILFRINRLKHRKSFPM